MTQTANHLSIRSSVGIALRGRHRLALLTGTWLLGALAAAPIAEAQDAKKKGDTLEEVVVTGHAEFFRPTVASSATKFDLDVQDTPQAIAVLTDDILDTFGARNLYDISKFVAGVTSPPSASNTNFFLGNMGARGFRIDGQSGFKINGFSTLREFQPDLVAVERIEFLKGPSSVLYGVNGYGGTINTVLKRPQNAAAYTLRVEGGSYDYYRAQGDATGPIGSGAVKYRLASAYQSGGSIQEGYKFDRVPVFGQLEFELGSATVLDTYVLYQEDRATDHWGWTGTLDENGRLVEPFGVDRKYFMADADVNRIRRESYQAFAGLTHVFENDYKLNVKVGYTNNDSRFRAMYVYNYGFAAAPFADVYYKRDVRKISSKDAELTFGGDFDAFGREHTFMVAGEFRNIRQDVTDFAFDNIGQVNMFAPDFSGLANNARPIVDLNNGGVNQDETRYAVAAQLLLRPADRWSVLLGGRYDRIKLDARNLRFDPDPTDNVFVTEYDVQTEQTLTHFTPRLGLLYEITPQLNAFLSYTEGFIPQPGITRQLSDLDPEQGNQYEAGVKGEFFGGRLGATLTLFHVDREDVGVPDPTNVPGESFRVDGRAQRHRGVEVEVLGQPRDDFNMVFTYAYLDAEITTDLSGAVLPGTAVLGAPEHSGSLYLQYEIPGGPLEGLAFGAGGVYVGKRTNQERRVVAPFGAGGGFPIFYLQDYTTVDASIRYYGFERVIFGIEATNLLDEDYFDVDSDCCGANFLQRGVSRQFRGFVSYKF